MMRPILAPLIAATVVLLHAFQATADPAAGGKPAAEASGGAPSARPHVHETLEGAAPLPGRSIYQLEGSYTAADGSSFPLAALRGRPVLVLLFYGTCQSVCPVLVRDLQRIDAQLMPAEQQELRYLLVTFDPDVDTTERLAAYAKAHDLPGDRFTLARGSNDQVRELAAVLGFRYRPTGDGQYSHTQRISLLDRDGVVIGKFDGVDRPLDPIVAAVRKEVTGPTAPGK